MKKRGSVFLWGILLVLLHACGSDTAPPAQGSVELYSITATSAQIQPGESTVINASATDSAGGALTYAWYAEQGSLSSTHTNPVTWTSPNAEGNYLVRLDVTNEAGSAASGIANLVVAAPAGPAKPVITNVSPPEAKVGEEIRVSGSGFGAEQGESTLNVGGVDAVDIVSWSDTGIVALVPLGASTGVVIATVDGVASDPGFFILLWTKEYPENVAVYGGEFNAWNPEIAADGKGGAFIAWQYAIGSIINGVQSDDWYRVSMQRVDGSGVPLWDTDGILIVNSPDNAGWPKMASDGSGGAVITWEVNKWEGGGIYAQRVDASGNTLWGENGVKIADSINPFKQITSDGAGGAIVVWLHSYDIYAQRVDASGTPLWTAGGVAVSNTPDRQFRPTIASDGSGGAIIVWEDERNSYYEDIYAQRLDASGTPLWSSNGVPVSTARLPQVFPEIISDGAGGAVITWLDARAAQPYREFEHPYDVYAQRLDAAGKPLWTANGVAVCTAAYEQSSLDIIPDDAGGAIISWQDSRKGTGDDDIYVQRVDASGTPLWTANGVLITDDSRCQGSPRIAPDGLGGAFITWEHVCYGGLVHAQRVDASGKPLWSANGVPVTDRGDTPRIVYNGFGVAVIAWPGIYAQGISINGTQ